MKHTITTYKELYDWSKAFVSGQAFGLFFLVGNPGHAKSYTLRKLLEEKRDADRKKASKRKVPALNTGFMPVTGERRPTNHKPEHLWIEGGNVSAFKLYQKIYEHLDQDIVLDDVDQAHKDQGLVRLLKSVCQTEKVKEISWTTQNKQLADAGVPASFKLMSRVAIIANHWKTMDQHVGSLESRGAMIEFAPSIQEVFDYVKKNAIIKDREVLDFVEKNLWLAQKIDIRDFINVVQAKNAKLPWQDALANSMGMYELMIIHKVRNMPELTYDEQWASEFIRLSGRSRPLYFKFRDKYTEIIDALKASNAHKPKPKGRGKKTESLGFDA